MSINRVSISGNLTRDPELRQTTSGTLVLSFGVAVNDRRKNSQTGEWEDVPNYVDCVVFGKRAEGLSGILCKGMKVAIDGKLRYMSWTTDDGQRRSKLEVTVDEIEFLSDSKARRAEAGNMPDNYTNQQQAGPKAASQGFSQPYDGQPYYYDRPF